MCSDPDKNLGDPLKQELQEILLENPELATNIDINHRGDDNDSSNEETPSSP